MGKSIAITGGIGSGKSTVLNFLKQLGFPVYSCDAIYLELLREKEYVSKLASIFPEVVIKDKIDKNRLASIVFSNKCAREQLNKLAHPLVMERLLKRMKEENSEIVFAEVPLLFEGNFEYLFDEVWVIRREVDERIKSVCIRDEISPNNVKARIESQIDYEDESFQKRIKNNKICLIENKGNLQTLKREVEKRIKIIM